jgi:hypothetical protein
MYGTTSLTRKNADLTFTSNILSHASSFTLRKNKTKTFI